MTACLGLGANLGDRRGAIESAAAAVLALPGVLSGRLSTIIATEPVGPPGQPAYLNAAMVVAIDPGVLGPRGLLDALLGIERAHGRERRERWGPRTLDLDILLYGDLVIDEPGLCVPHPRMAERVFVLRPLAEVGGEIVHPVTRLSIRGMLEAVDEPFGRERA